MKTCNHCGGLVATEHAEMIAGTICECGRSSATCSRCAELEKELAAIKAILADPVAVHVNVLRGTIAKLSDANVKHVYPHLFENTPLSDAVRSDKPTGP